MVLVFEKQVKRMLASCKQRDVIDASKRSIFYSILYKLLINLSSISEYKCLRALSMTAADF